MSRSRNDARTHARPRGAARSRGFSLLEVLVAFVVLALVATALFRLFSGALNNAGAADDYSRAVLLAESRVDEAAAGKLAEGVQSGTTEDDRLRWTVTIAPYLAPEVNPDMEKMTESLPLRMYRISARVAFAGGGVGERTVTLSTIRIGPAEPQ